MKLKSTLGLAIWLAVAPLSAIAAGVEGLNVYKNATVLACSEKIYRHIDEDNPGPAIHTGIIQVVDFGDSFFAISTDNNALAYSGPLSELKDNNFKEGRPVPGVVMAKGGRKQTGVYIYTNPTSSIVWDCRK